MEAIEITERPLAKAMLLGDRDRMGRTDE